MHFKTIPLSLQAANAWVELQHRHHHAVHRDKFRFGIVDDTEQLVGVVQVGRPVARGYDDGCTVEVVRLCTNGTKNACSFGYATACKIAKLLGYEKVVTYILDEETGTSLRASGFTLDHYTAGGQWDTPSRRRNPSVCPQPKCCYIKYL